jgi:hypothetical protein
MNEIDDWIRDPPEIKTCSIAGVLEGIKSLPIQKGFNPLQFPKFTPNRTRPKRGIDNVQMNRYSTTSQTLWKDKASGCLVSRDYF